MIDLVHGNSKQLTPEEERISQLELAIRRDKPPEMRQRGIAIRFLQLGQKVGEMAQIQAVSKPTIYGWWKRWCAGGIEGLANQPKSRRSPKANEAYIALVEEVVE